MNKQSNTYIVIYATILVVVVAAVLSFVSLKLKPLQLKNVEIEKKSDVLQSAGLLTTPKGDYNKGIENQYNKYITSFLINSNGDITSENSQDAFKALINIKAIFKMDAKDRTLPVFVSKSNNGEIKYIFPVNGTGLWGPIWGFVSLSDDFDTIYGVVFGHQSETPGLGAEIATPVFENQFKGKKLFKDGVYKGLLVLKGEGASVGNQNAVDAISGGTITSVAVQDMLVDCLGSGYRVFIEKMKIKRDLDLIEVELLDEALIEKKGTIVVNKDEALVDTVYEEIVEQEVIVK